MPIDIDALSEPELVDLNHRIVERLRFLHQIHAHQAMLKFSIGDRVTFEDGQGRKVEGTLTRYNRKSVTVIGADGRHWNIAPGFLRKADQAAASKTPNIIALPKRYETASPIHAPKPRIVGPERVPPRDPRIAARTWRVGTRRNTRTRLLARKPRA